MKLYDLLETKDDNKLDQHLKFSKFGEWVKEKVVKQLMKGDSKLKNLLITTNFTMDHVRYAIITGNCLKDPSPKRKSLGPTYLEQTISNILRDLVNDHILPLDKLNDARDYFGLDKLSHRELQLKHKVKSYPTKR